MKTNIYTPDFYLAHKDLLIRINAKTIIGRNQGDIILEDDALLSTIHCEVRPSLMDVFIKDLDSTNGVIVNRQKLTPNTEVKLEVGDVVKIGTRDYIFFDNELEAKKLLPKRDKRKHPRPENLYGFKNLINFYSAHNAFRAMYLIVLLMAAASFILNINITVPAPKNLEFLYKIYSDKIVFSGIQSLFVVWAISLLHSFLMVLYLNRNPVRKFIGVFFYLTTLYFAVDFQNGPLGGIKGYLIERNSAEMNDKSDKAITNLKFTLNSRDNLIKYYKYTKKRVNDDQKVVLEKDFNKSMKSITNKI